MEKQRPKPLPWGGSAQPVGKGGWEWTTGSYVWRWWERLGLNVEIAAPGCDFQPVIHAKKISEAFFFSEGWHAGMVYGKRNAESLRSEEG